MTTLTLSNVRPDFEDLVAQLQGVLSTFNSWQDFITSATGQTLIEFIAAVGAFDQYAVESSLQEAFPVTAKNDASIFAAVQMLGVRLDRKRPARITATFTRPIVGSIIPPMSQFTGAGSFFYNREAITVPVSPALSAPIDLYQGVVVAVSLTGLGTDFQAFVTPETNFTVSDGIDSIGNPDTYVIINAVAVEVTRTGLWQLKGTSGVQDTTLSNGSMALLFGSDLYGSKPGTNDSIVIQYVVTAGANGNNLITLGQKLTYDIDNLVVIVCTSQPTAGADQSPATVYKSVAAPVFGAFGSAVTRDQYVSTPFLYSGVVDSLMFAQREINPNALKWMNVIKVILLTSSVWSDVDYKTFFTWLQNQTMYAVRFVKEIPAPKINNIDVDVFCTNAANLNVVKANVVAAITALFAIKPGILNRDFYRSDITEAVFGADPSIEYLILNTPSTDMLISRAVTGFPTAAVVGGGSLVTGQFYDYAVSYNAVDGSQYAPLNWVNIEMLGGGNGSITLTWASVPNAANYIVWGRQTSGSLGMLATLANTVFSYTDTGSASPVLPLLEEDIVIYRYNSLGSLTVNVDYSSRRAV
jgi:hypothetical protein